MAIIHLACIVGARPNFMKMAPLLGALASEQYRGEVSATLIHTGQHYDQNLSNVFFAELGMPRPDVSLGVGSGAHGAQTARILERVETTLLEGPSPGVGFDRLVVVGDVNSTMAATLAAVKMGIPVAHVEAGLRSFDRTMPEEINRVVTDSVADMLLVSEPAGVTNLLNEGHCEAEIHLVGNLMIDTLYRMLPHARDKQTAADLGLESTDYGVVTLHRPSNVDDLQTLTRLMQVLTEISEDLPLVFPVHPRTRARLTAAGLLEDLDSAENLHLLEPLGYLAFLSLTSQARVIVTDSGGLQEESTALGIPCLTLRANTERPITVDEGTSTLLGNDAGKLRDALLDVVNNRYKLGRCPELWDGKAAERIAEVLMGKSSI